MNNNYTVYMHTVIANGKRYVGMTGKDVRRRWGGNGCAYTKSQYFAKAIAKYGWENIKHEILFTGLSKEEAEKKEIELITMYDLTNHSKGYNIAHGGGGTVGVKASEETRRKLSISHKNGKKPKAIPIVCLSTGDVYSSIREAAEKTGCNITGIRDCLTGKKNTTGGLKFEAINEKDRKQKPQKMSKRDAALLGSAKAREVNVVRVAQYDLNGNLIAVHPSMVEARKSINAKSSHISGCAKGKRKTAFGYTWRRVFIFGKEKEPYNTGDIVNYNGTLYKSLIDGNVWAPDAYPAGWEVYTEA